MRLVVFGTSPLAKVVNVIIILGGTILAHLFANDEIAGGWLAFCGGILTPSTVFPDTPAGQLLHISLMFGGAGLVNHFVSPALAIGWLGYFSALKIPTGLGRTGTGDRPPDILPREVERKDPPNV